MDVSINEKERWASRQYLPPYLDLPQPRLYPCVFAVDDAPAEIIETPPLLLGRKVRSSRRVELCSYRSFSTFLTPDHSFNGGICPPLPGVTAQVHIKTVSMTDDHDMDIDTPAEATTSQPQNAMAALMAGAKAKGKERDNGDNAAAFGMSEEELKRLNEREGLPW